MSERQVHSRKQRLQAEMGAFAGPSRQFREASTAELGALRAAGLVKSNTKNATLCGEEVAIKLLTTMDASAGLVAEVQQCFTTLVADGGASMGHADVPASSSEDMAWERGVASNGDAPERD